MLARLFLQGDQSPLVHELARMGHPHPDAVLQKQGVRRCWKLLDVPRDIAKHFTDWLQPQDCVLWWHQTAGARTDMVDLLLEGTEAFPRMLRQATVPLPYLTPVLTVLEQAQRLRETAPQRLRLGATSLPVGARTLVMGIVNVTPDSFSDGGLYFQHNQAIKHAEAMLTEGADLIDIGGQSSRPGAIPVPEEVEYQRVIPVIREVAQRSGALVSVDTYRASIAAAALDAGAVLINDISAMRFDPRMLSLLAERQAAVVLMHMQGTPQTMQQAPTYHHVVDDVYRFLAERLQTALQHGLTREQILLDPGIGFGKSVEHCLDVLRDLEHLRGLGQPLLVGTSRKSFLGGLLQREVWDRLEGTIASVVYAILRGVSMVRVHDVKSVVQAVRVVDALHRIP